MKYLRAVSLLLVTLLLISISHIIFGKNSGLLIVTTFSNIVKDIEQLICSSDRVLSIVPQGADPHDYSLKPSDIELINTSNLVVSTKHTHFEEELSELISKGVVKTDIVEIPSIQGIVLRTNPSTSVLNYHMPIYDPLNYIVFINYLSNKLQALNPHCSETYRARAIEVADKILRIYLNTPRLNKTVVADYPYIQYAIEWIGFKIIDFVVEEHGLETKPDLDSIERLIDSKSVDLVAVTEPVVSKHSKWLLSKALENDIPVIRVYSPLFNNTIVDKLMYIYSQLLNLTSAVRNTSSLHREYATSSFSDSRMFLEIVTFLSGVALFVLTVLFITTYRKVIV